MTNYKKQFILALFCCALSMATKDTHAMLDKLKQQLEEKIADFLNEQQDDPLEQQYPLHGLSTRLRIETT